jgi:hypothetical protein
MKKLSLTIAALTLFFGITFGQDSNNDSHSVNFTISSFAILDIESSAAGNTTIDLTPNIPTEAGLGLDYTGVQNSALWLNYSSIVSPSKSRTITAQMSSANLPAGVTLNVATATASSSAKKGNVGSGTSAQAISTDGTAVTVVSGIGTCITGDGPSNGCQLTYTVDFDDSQYASLEEGSYGATITYTISDQN